LQIAQTITLFQASRHHGITASRHHGITQSPKVVQNTMLDALPIDVLNQILRFLMDDGTSVGRISSCSSNLHDYLCGQNSSDLWRDLVQRRWTKRRPDADAIQNYRSEYLRRHEIDHKVMQILKEMESDLRELLGLKEENDMVDGSSHINQAYNNPSLNHLLSLRSDVVDILILQANKRTRLFGFLAARTLQIIHLIECYYEWDNITNMKISDEIMSDPHRLNSIALERYAILLCGIQRTPMQLLDKDTDIALNIVTQLDQIADDCRRRIQIQPPGTVMEKIAIVNDVLANQYGFSGNESDYYNYKNSLLFCTLQSKKSIPITLCTLYACVCTRLGLHAHLVGLPGHVVIGLHENEDNPIFIDVFNQCKLLSIHDCQDICNSLNISWSTTFLAPLPARNVFQRMLNNLANCHVREVRQAHLFLGELYFQQQLFASINGQQPGLSRNGIEIISQYSFKLSPELLRYYSLLS